MECQIHADQQNLRGIALARLCCVLERILGLISNPGIFTDAQTGPGGLDLDKEVLEDIGIAAEVLLKLPDDDIIAVPMTYLNKSLVYPVQGKTNKIRLSKSLKQMTCLDDFSLFSHGGV